MLPGYHPLQQRCSLVITPQVRFVRRADPRTKKDAASRIVQLPQGATPTPNPQPLTMSAKQENSASAE